LNRFFFLSIIGLEVFPLDVRCVVLLLTSFLIVVGDEFLVVFVFVDKTDGANFGLARLVM